MRAQVTAVPMSVLTEEHLVRWLRAAEEPWLEDYGV